MLQRQEMPVSMDVSAVIPEVVQVPTTVPEYREATPKVVLKTEKRGDSFQKGYDNAKVAPDSLHEPNPRQVKILEYIATSREAKISDFFSVLAGVSSKTIQRDLSELVDKNFLKKQGDKRWTTYSLNVS